MYQSCQIYWFLYGTLSARVRGFMSSREKKKDSVNRGAKTESVQTFTEENKSGTMRYKCCTDTNTAERSKTGKQTVLQWVSTHCRSRGLTQQSPIIVRTYICQEKGLKKMQVFTKSAIKKRQNWISKLDLLFLIFALLTVENVTLKMIDSRLLLVELVMPTLKLMRTTFVPPGQQVSISLLPRCSILLAVTTNHISSELD